MTDAERFAKRISENLVKTKIGSLRFWGQWFGRPFAKIHRIVACNANRDLLRLGFNEGEVLSVWSPTDLESSKLKFQIGSATRVQWEWYSYGRPKIAANLYFLDFAKERGAIIVNTNGKFGDGFWEPSDAFPAVEMLTHSDMKMLPDPPKEIN